MNVNERKLPPSFMRLGNIGTGALYRAHSTFVRYQE